MIFAKFKADSARERFAFFVTLLVHGARTGKVTELTNHVCLWHNADTKRAAGPHLCDGLEYPVRLSGAPDPCPECPVSYLSEIETGKKPGSIAAYRALADALDLAIDDLAR